MTLLAKGEETRPRRSCLVVGPRAYPHLCCLQACDLSITVSPNCTDASHCSGRDPGYGDERIDHLFQLPTSANKLPLARLPSTRNQV